jgi:MFS family permease
VGLIFIAVFIALLAGPILAEALFDLFGKAVEKTAKGGFLLGLGILLIGLLSGTRVLEIAGGALLGVVVLAVIADNYLVRARLTLREAGPGVRWAPRSSPLSWQPLPGLGPERWRGSG